MTATTIAEQLRDAIGLDAQSIGPAALARAVEQRMGSLKIRNELAYADLIASSEGELHELIENVVVAETWFFRDREAFIVLADLVVPRRGPLHVLSAPCSTGEEPYSIAMALLEAGLPPARFTIDAIDVSGRALAVARVGRYGKNSFRGDDLRFRERHFEPAGSSWILRDDLRSTVHFAEGNLLQPDLQHLYDVIFCRNLLIYCDTAAQQKILATLHRLLQPDGLLFVGPAETTLAAINGFTPVRHALSFALQKRVEAPLRAPISVVAPKPKLVRGDASRRPPGERPAKAIENNTLRDAERLADSGQLARARAISESILRRTPDSAAVHYLLGIIAEGERDDARAADAYRKALYLQPDHLEALVHYALLAEKRGDVTAATQLFDRARRAEQQRKHSS